jgi:hypothetical protein
MLRPPWLHTLPRRLSSRPAAVREGPRPPAGSPPVSFFWHTPAAAVALLTEGNAPHRG